MPEADRSTLRLIADLNRTDVAGQVPILVGNTSDIFIDAQGTPSRLTHLLAKWAAYAGRSTVVHSLSAGTYQLPPPGSAPVPLHLPAADAPPAQVLTHLRGQLDTATSPIQLILNYVDLSVPITTGMVSLEFNRVVELISEFALDPAFSARGHRLALIARVGNLDDRLQRVPGFVLIEATLPDYFERLMFAERLCMPASGAPLLLADSLPPEHLARLSGGLTLDDLYRGRDESQHSGPLTAAWVQARKTESLRRLGGQNLRIYPAGRGLADVAGLPQVRRLVVEAKAANQLPRRIVFAGPPGVGKTLVVTAIADEFGVPAVALGNFRSMYVGESERRLNETLTILQSLAPCCLHVDEMDQAIGQRTTGQSADAGTSERIMADLLTFLGDSSRSEWVTVIGTTNRPDLLDPALLDRFIFIPVLHPDPTEAAQILRIAADRQGWTLDDTDAVASVHQFNGLLTGRILVDVIDRAIVLASLDGSQGEIGRSQLDRAFADLLMALDPLEHEFLALQAIQLATFRSFLPWNAARARGEEPHLPEYLLPLLDHDGDIDSDKLRARLHELLGRHNG